MSPLGSRARVNRECVPPLPPGAARVFNPTMWPTSAGTSVTHIFQLEFAAPAHFVHAGANGTPPEIHGRAGAVPLRDAAGSAEIVRALSAAPSSIVDFRWCTPLARSSAAAPPFDVVLRVSFTPRASVLKGALFEPDALSDPVA